MANRQSANNAENRKRNTVKPSELITYLQHLADDFELNSRHTEAIYLREAAGIVASHTMTQLTRCTMTLGDRVFDMMTGTPDAM